MKHLRRDTIFMILTVVIALSCNKIYDGSPGVGGNIPNSFIAVKDSSFNPVAIEVVAGSSIAFINNTNTAKQIQSDDSARIPLTTIQAGGSFIYRSNTAGSFQYFRKDKPTVRGLITLRP